MSSSGMLSMQKLKNVSSKACNHADVQLIGVHVSDAAIANIYATKVAKMLIAQNVARETLQLIGAVFHRLLDHQRGVVTKM